MGDYQRHHERSQHEDEIEFVDKKASHRGTNIASVIRVLIEEHHAVLGLANQTDKISELKKKIRKDTIASFCGISCLWTEGSNARQR
jgi:hypothetical protein